MPVITQKTSMAKKQETTPNWLVLDADGLRWLARAQPAARKSPLIATPHPVIADICVTKDENCFPMIPSGEPHNNMLLGDASTEDAIKAGGASLV